MLNVNYSSGTMYNRIIKQVLHLSIRNAVETN
jgi:hypothetical protein